MSLLRWLARFVVLVLCCGNLTAQRVSAEEGQLRIGYAQVDITPDPSGESPVWMAGYGQNRRATAIHDALHARALVVEDGKQRIALVSVDLVGLQRPEVVRIRTELTGFDYVLVASTHDHEGPDVVGIWGAGPLTSGVDPQYIDSVVEKTVAAVREASENLREATASYGTAVVSAELLRDSRLPIVRDDILRVIMFRPPGEPEKAAALLVQYSCHPESLGSENTEITADFPFATVAALQRQYQCPVIYFTGAVGGLMSNPGEFVSATGQSYRDGTFEYATAYGGAIADVAVKAVEASQPVSLTPIRVAAAEVAAPLTNPLYQAARAIGVLKRDAVVYSGDWRDVSVIATPETPIAKLAIKTEVACIALGDVTIAAVPGEIYPELVYGRYQEPADPNADFPDAPLEPSLIEALDSEHPLILGLANDEIGYIIPRRQWDERPPYAYGRDESQYGEVNSCGPEIAPIIMDALQEMSRQLRE